VGAGPRPHQERGSVTAEFALSLPVVVLAMIVALAVGQVVMAQVRCSDAARAGAREAARGEAGGTVVQEALRVAPPGAGVTLARRGRCVEVTVATAVRLPLPGSPRARVRGRAVSLSEQP
jgi:hypothetical protein